MKNKILKIVTIFSLVGLFSSCDEELDQSPNDGVTEGDLLTNVEGFNTALNGCYSGFMGEGYYGEARSYLMTPDVLTDNLIFNPQGRQTQRDLFEWRYTAVDEAAGIYEQGYKIIARANRILDNITNLSAGSDRDNIEGQALAIRAMSHFDIVRTYAKIPTQSSDANSSMGIAYIDSFNPAEFPVRDNTITVQSTYEKIVADLLSAESKIASDNGIGYLNKAAVAGILSRVYLHMGNWDKVIEYAQVAENEGAQVTSRANFSKIWLDEENVLFKIKVLDQNNVSPGVPYSQANGAGEVRAEYVVAFDFYELFEDTDIRKSGTISTSDFGGNTYNNISKYYGRASGNKNVVDGKYIRMEEVFLNKAEAAFENGDEATALTALDEIRSNRYDGFTSGNESGQELEDAIQLERRLELAFESDRFFTLKRRGESVNRSTTYGEFSDGSGTPAVETNLSSGDDRWQLPIPKSAIDNNSNITQNPGY